MLKKTKNLNKYNIVIYWVSAIVVLIGFSVIIGWVLDIEILRTIGVQYSSMKFNAAIGFILSGASLFYCNKYPQSPTPFIVRIFAGILLTLGVLTFGEILFNHDIGIDQLLMTDFEKSVSGAADTGRMAPTSAICFLLFALYLFFFNVESKMYRSFAQGLLHLITLISFIAIIGYLFNVPFFYKISYMTSMAIHTAICFFLLSIAASLINPSLGLTGLFTGASIGNIMARILFFQTTIAILVLGYLRILAHRYSLVNEEFGIALFATSFILTCLLLIWRVSGQLNAIDIKKQQAEAKLSRYKNFLDATPDPIIIIDGEGIIRLLNNATEKVFGYEKQVLTGQNIALLNPETVINGHSSSIVTMLISLQQQHFDSGEDHYAVRKDGKKFPVEITASPIETSEGSYTSVAFRDISQRKRQEKEIKEMAKIIAYSSDAIFSQDIAGNILSWNGGAEKLFGYTSDEIIGRPVSILLQAELEEETKSLTTKIFNQINIDQYETVRIKKDGTPVVVSLTMSPIKDREENITAISTILHDITEKKAAEISQKESSERNKLFIQQSPNAIAMFDKDMLYLAVSKKWLADYNLVGKDIIGHSHYEIFPEIGDDWKKIHQAGLQGQINQCDEEYFERTDGSYQWITWDVRPWYIAEGKIGGLILYTADITLLKQKDDEKRRIEEILDSTYEVARIGTWEVDVINNKTSWSRVTKEIHEVAMDYEPEVESSINFCREGKSRQKMEHAVNEGIKNGTDFDMELALITAKGKIIWVRAIGHSEFKNGVCQRLFGIFQDIDEAIRSKQALQMLNNELNILLNTGNVSIIGTDNAGLITYFNKGAENMLQYAASEMVGIQTPAIFMVQEEMEKKGNELAARYNSANEGLDAFKEIVIQEDFVSDEWTHVRKDGSTFPMQVVTTTIRNTLSEPMGILGVGVDISNLKNAEKKLVELNESIQSINRQLNQKNEELEQFAYVAAHDLQEPLRMISSFLTLLERKYAHTLDDKAKEYISYSVDGAIRMKELIKDILNFSKSGTVNNQPFDLDSLVKKIAKSYKKDEKNQSAIIEVDTLPVLNVDASAMQQLFTNLIGNGLKYQPVGNTPVIKVTAAELKDKWLFKIADNGIGIDPKHYDKIFAIFKRLHTKSTYAGTGIGLATCKKIVSVYNGDIWIEPNNENGSVFCFTISK